MAELWILNGVEVVTLSWKSRTREVARDCLSLLVCVNVPGTRVRVGAI